MTLEVRESNAEARALYARFGFEVAGLRKNYYSDLGEDAVVMWATEIQAPEYERRLGAIEASMPGHTVLEDWR
jgi:hypothetical protein